VSSIYNPPTSTLPRGYNVSATMEVDVPTPEQQTAWVRAALEAGATSAVPTFRPSSPGIRPDPPALAPAVKQATDVAMSTAQVSAQASGVTLGSLKSTLVQPPRRSPTR
jgi:uncharacterized protein YggE